MNLTDQFIDNVYAFARRSFSEDLLSHARKCLLDYLAATVAGAKEYYSVEESFLDLPISNGGVSTIIGHKKKTSPSIAALINGISAHAVELDDGQRFGNIHPGAPVISSLLAVGEANGMTINDLWRGILTGYESVLRLACSIQPGHKQKGFHATGPCGAIGASLGIAAMLGFSRIQFKASLSAACTSASGILEMIEGDTQMMPYNAGKAASNAVVSAAVGYSGFKIPDDALGGNRGFLHCFADNSIRYELLSNFNHSYYCISNYFKPYAACGHCHASIEAALKLREEQFISIEEIEHVEIETYKLALRGHDHTSIKGVNSARMSIPYSTVVALIRGSAGIEDFSEEIIKNKKLLEIVKDVAISENVDFTKEAPAKRMAKVTVHTSRGVFSKTVDYPKGQPENPMSMDDIVRKFYNCAQYAGLSADSVDRIVGAILGDNTSMSISELGSAIV